MTGKQLLCGGRCHTEAGEEDVYNRHLEGLWLELPLTVFIACKKWSAMR